MQTLIDNMPVVPAGRPLIECVKWCYRANRPLLLVGWPGVGKSEILSQAAKQLGIRCISIDLSIMDNLDLGGLPVQDGRVTRHLPLEFLPTKGKGLLVFEELNRCDRLTRAPCLQLLTARRLNTYRLPAGWLPAASINPPDADYEVQDLGPAILSRFTRLRVMPDTKTWLDWARTRGLHKAVIDYVANNPTVFVDEDHDLSNPPGVGRRLRPAAG